MLLTMLLGSWADARPPRAPAQVEAIKQRREGSLKVGDVAPDAPVVTLAGDATTLLAAKKAGRPLVLIFGSFT